VITFMNKKAQQLTSYAYTAGSVKKLEEVYHTERPAEYPARRVWKAIPGSAGMMTEKEITTLITSSNTITITQQVFHFFDNKGEMKEKIIAFLPEDITAANASVSDKAYMPASRSGLHYAQVAAATGDLCWEWDIEECVMHCFSEQADIFGYDRNAATNTRQWWKSNIHPEDAANVQAVYTRAIEEKKTVVQTEYRFRFTDGKFRHVLDRATVICNPVGEPVKLIGIMQDITQIKLEEKRLSEAVLNAQEAERKTIGAELHDNINQVLATSVLHLGMIHEQAQHPEKVRELVKTTKTYTMKAVDEIRKLSHELSPVNMDDTDFEEYIRELLSSFNADDRFEIQLDFDRQVRESLTDEMQLHFYRILQEQLKNIRKHAEASAIVISVKAHQNAIELMIADNGKGFDQSAPCRGVGLANIRRRGQLIGGCVGIKAAPGKGCQIQVKVFVDPVT
ncbi:MAG: PAS domain-containing protein, partial [Chitinophagaceae bacterium]|nr:PAS domain-containing protein [Chitinophagaceae bacterium]